MILSQLVEKYPDLRFGQILDDFNFVISEENSWRDEFFTEPDVIKNRVRKTIEVTNE